MRAGEVEAIVVIGACSVTDADLATLLDRGVPDSAVTAWAGAHTIIRVTVPNHVTLWTDPAGACPIYTTGDGDGGLVWGSSSRALSSLVGGQVDEQWLATALVNRTAGIPGRSAFAGVGMLPPGHRVALAAGRVTTLTPAWAPRRLPFAEAVQQVRDTLAAAVQVRVAATTAAADLSGGLDSTTVAVLAAQTSPVTAITLHPATVTAGGDLDHARVTVAANPNLRHTLLPLDDLHLPFTHLDTLPATDEPAPSTVTWAMLSAQFRLLVDTGVTCHLTGDGGDTLFLQPPIYVADLLRRGRWLRTALDIQGWARLRRISPWPLLADALAGRASPSGLAGGSPRWLTRKATDLALRPGSTDDGLGLDLADRDLLARARFAARTGHTETQLADAFGITMHNPYLDGRVLDTVLGVPGWQRGTPYEYKPLLAAATTGLLPEAVRTRAAKGIFAGDHHRGIRANLDRLLGLAGGRLAERGLITPRPAQDEIRRAAAGLRVNWASLKSLLAAEIWLGAVETTRPVQWTTPERQANPA